MQFSATNGLTAAALAQLDAARLREALRRLWRLQNGDIGAVMQREKIMQEAAEIFSAPPPSTSALDAVCAEAAGWAARETLRQVGDDAIPCREHERGRGCLSPDSDEVRRCIDADVDAFVHDIVAAAIRARAVAAEQEGKP